MNEIERMVRSIFFTHGETRKIPIEEEDLWCYDYEENYIIQKRMRHKELREYIMEKGYTGEQAEEIILDCRVRGVIDLVNVDLDERKSKDKDEYVTANEEYWVEEETEILGGRVIDEFMNSEVKDYVMIYPFDFDDEDEEKLREVYFEHNEKYLSRNQLITGLMRKGYTEGQAQIIIEKYTTKEIEKKIEDWWDEYKAENLFKRPEYKPLKYHENKRIVRLKNKDKDVLELKNEDFIIREIPECFEIMQIEEWLLKEYEDLTDMRHYSWHTFGMEKAQFRTIRKIFREAEKQGKETLTRSELKQKIIKECKATEEEAEKQGKETLTYKELVQKVLEAYQKYKEKSGWPTYTKTINREYAEMMIEEAEEQLLIIADKEKDGENKFRLDYTILTNKTNTKQ